MSLATLLAFHNVSFGQFALLHSFTGETSSQTTTDGASPQAPMIQGLDGTFYGVTYYGGSTSGNLGDGTVYKMSPQGTITILYSFNTTGGNNGKNPVGALVLSNGYLYGVTNGGGSDDSGTICKIKTDGTLYSIMHSFGDPLLFSSDGLSPMAGLTLESD